MAQPTEPAVESEAPPSGAPAEVGFLQNAKSLWQELACHLHDSVQLAALETRLAAESLVTMIVAGIIAAILVVSAWLGLIAAAVMALIGAGMIPALAVLLAVLANLLLALALYLVVRGKGRNLRWAATIRTLAPSSLARDP